MRGVRTPILDCLGLGHEIGKADRRDKVESDNSAGGP